jgi:signal transduction histidine kinase
MLGLHHIPIAMRAPLMAAALMVLVGLVASQQVLAALTQAQEARLRELAQLHVDGLSVALGPSVLRHDVWEVYDTLDRASGAGENRRMVMTAVADETGRIIAATDPRRAPVDSPVAALAANAQELDEISVDAAIPHVRVLAPLVFQGRSVGRIVTELDVSDLVADRRRAVFYLLLFNTIATGVLALTGYLAMRRMLRPMATLSMHMGESTGKPTPIPVSEIPLGDTEVAKLFRTFNEMTGAIEAKVEAERRLAERERFVSLGRLASSLAHEINNPLGGLVNATDTIQRYSDRPDVVRSSAALLERGLKHLRDVTRAALDHNRRESAHTRLRPEDFDDLRLLMTPEIERQGQRLDWTIQATTEDLGGFPAGPVRQIALNLLLNASAAAGKGGFVGLSLARSVNAITITLVDNGPGLPDAALRRLLTSEAVQPGSGVGLRIVRDLVMEMSGQISHRRSAELTEIIVTLPPRRMSEVA